MKKIFSSILTLSLLVSTSALAVSCHHAALNQGREGERILLVTDMGTINDRGFNEQIYQSILEYSNRENQENQWGFDFQELGYSAKNNWVQPLRSDYESYVNSYKLGRYKGTDIYVLSGFQHEMSRRAASQIAGTDKTVIIVDSAILDGENNVMPLSFSSQLAGFSAAYDSAVWATTINPETNKMKGQVYSDKNEIGFGVYGGISMKNGPGSYLWGFLAGMAYFNARVLRANQSERHIRLSNFGIKGELNELNGIQPTDIRFFSNSFEIGGANKAGINDLLGPKNGKADVIFPVAGGQIIDTLTANAFANIVGVDSNQALQFPEYQNRFITSATKDLKLALFDAFDHSKANRYNHYILENGDLGDLRYDENTPAKGDFWDGMVPTPKNSWSHDLDQTKKEPGIKIPKTLVDFVDKDKGMADVLIKFFKETGSTSTDFLTWKGEHGIEKLIQQLLTLPELPLEFDS